MKDETPNVKNRFKLFPLSQQPPTGKRFIKHVLYLHFHSTTLLLSRYLPAQIEWVKEMLGYLSGKC